ncbi:hypothetical protein CB599_11725 [Salmonella enterica subsp. enterica serovar Adjame]|nr:hypothetical protein [Salmonella enterica subsp. enterica serovar Adjame]
MAGRRTTLFNDTVKRLKAELRLKNRAEVIGFMAVSSEVPGWMNSKARRMIAKAERKQRDLF